MPKFTVYLQQYVEQTASLEIEADSAEEARDKALSNAPSADWDLGDDAYAAEVYRIEEIKTVWER